ncbi:MAG: hypothetical protein ACE5OZ_06965 [Candidatus Heimdallarchaeota archaeon]
MKKASYSELASFQVILCGLRSYGLFSLFEQLSLHHNLLLPEINQILATRSQPPLRINYWGVELPDVHGRLKDYLTGVDALLFVIPPDPIHILQECHTLLLVVQNYLPLSTSILLLVDQPNPDCIAPIEILIEELHVADFADNGISQIGVLSVCTQAEEGLDDVVWRLFNLLTEKIHDPSSSSVNDLNGAAF